MAISSPEMMLVPVAPRSIPLRGQRGCIHTQVDIPKASAPDFPPYTIFIPHTEVLYRRESLALCLHTVVDQNEPLEFSKDLNALLTQQCQPETHAIDALTMLIICMYRCRDDTVQKEQDEGCRTLLDGSNIPW